MDNNFSSHYTYKKLLLVVLPTILMMVFTSVYSIVDGLFISNFAGKTPFAAVNLIFPVTMIIGGVGFMFGSGGSALVAKTMGEGDNHKANRMFTMIIVFTIISGILISSIIFILLEEIARVLGGTKSSELMIQQSVIYGRILLSFMPVFMLQNVFQSFFVVANKAKLGFVVTALAGVTNMVLDALFVGLFKWGVVGAGVATGISQMVGGIIPFIYVIKSKNCVLKFTKTKLELKVLVKSATNGSSELLSNISASIVGMLYNMQLLKIAGENGVAAYGVIMYAGFIFCAIFIGYSIGVAPIISYNFGAKNENSVKNLLKKSLIITAITSILMVTLTEIFSGPLSAIFVSYDKELLDMTANGFRLYGICFAICGFNIFASGFFTALNDGLMSAIISFLRTLVFQIVFILLLPAIWDLNGIWLANVFAETCALLVSLICFIANRRKYRYF